MGRVGFPTIARGLTWAAWLAACWGMSSARADEFDELSRLQQRIQALQAAGQYQQAVPLAQQLVARAEVVFRNQPANLMSCLNELANLYHTLGRFQEAQPLYERSLAILEKALGRNHPDVGRCVSNLGMLLMEQGRFAEAEPLCKRALATLERALGPDHRDVAGTLNNLASLYNNLGRYGDAEPLCKRALAILEKAVGPNHPEVAKSVNNLGHLCDIQGRWAEAEPLYKRAVTIWEKVAGPQHPLLAHSLSNLANLYDSQGRWAEAEPLHQRALAIREKAFGPEHPDVAKSLSNLVVLYQNQGRYPEVEPLYRRALSILEKALGPEHPDVAGMLNNLASAYVDLGRLGEAEPLYRRSLDIREKILGAEHPLVADSLNNLGNLFDTKEDYLQAEPLYRRALTIREKVLGPEHPSVATSLNNLATMYERQQKYAEAEELVDRAIAIRDIGLAAPNDSFQSYFLRARLAWQLGRKGEAVSDLRRALDLAEQARGRAAGSEHERAGYFGLFASAFETMVTWQRELGDAGEAIAAIERSRARSLLDGMRVGAADLDAGRPAAEREALHRREVELKSRIARLEQDGDLSRLAEAKAELYDFYRQQRSTSPVYRNLLAVGSGPPRVSQLQRALLADRGLMLVYLVGQRASHVAVLEAGHTRVDTLQADEQQAAVLGIEPGPLTARGLQKLFLAQENGLLAQMSGAATAETASPKLAALWQVLVPAAERQALTGEKFQRLIVVPDGPLALLPFETLVVEAASTTRYLLDVGPPVLYAPSATVLYNLAGRRGAPWSESAEPTLAVGGALYGSEATALAALDGPNQAVARSRHRGPGPLNPLPHSQTEVQWVAEVCRNCGWRTGTLTQQQATEAAVRKAIAGRRIVHFACHGLTEHSFGNLFGALALTPGPRAASDPADDGFLTLAEIYGLDLRACELSILSACQTNYGPQQQGEGTWALSRGFLVAGSRRVVASNWLVDDSAAASLVSIFCGAVAKGQQAGAVDYAAALHQAKRKIREQANWSSPYYWGTFVLVGPN